MHKANILKKTDGLFLSIFNEIKQEYPDIVAEDKIIDNMCMQLVTNPSQFDCIVTPNLYGDILSDLISGLVGGLGVAPAANIGNDIAIFEAVHGSAPDIAGKGLANPMAIFLSGALCLDYIGENEKAKLLRKAIIEITSNGDFTVDIGGCLTTEEFADLAINKIKRY